MLENMLLRRNVKSDDNSLCPKNHHMQPLSHYTRDPFLLQIQAGNVMNTCTTFDHGSKLTSSHILLNLDLFFVVTSGLLAICRRVFPTSGSSSYGPFRQNTAITPLCSQILCSWHASPST